MAKSLPQDASPPEPPDGPRRAWSEPDGTDVWDCLQEIPDPDEPGSTIHRIVIGKVLDGLTRYVRRFVVLDDEQADAIALWVAHTHAFAAAEVTPYLQISSAEKRSGKTTLLEVLELLVARPWRVVDPTAAVLFRKIELAQPTLLWMSTTRCFDPKRGDRRELRNILNAGHRSGATVPRTRSGGAEIQEFRVFCPKALAGIGSLPSTVADRSILIRLKRRAPGEEADRFRLGDGNVWWSALKYRGLLGSWSGWWADDDLPELRLARPDVPAEIDDRAAQGWEPLVAIAEQAGGDWPERALRAARALSSGQRDEEASDGERLLADIHRVFEQSGKDRIQSRDLAAALKEIDTSPWADWQGEGTIQLARLLKPHGIESQMIRFGTLTRKGYDRSDFAGRVQPVPASSNHGRTVGTERQGRGSEPVPGPASSPAPLAPRQLDPLQNRLTRSTGSTVDLVEPRWPLARGDYRGEGQALLGEQEEANSLTGSAPSGRSPRGGLRLGLIRPCPRRGQIEGLRPGGLRPNRRQRARCRAQTRQARGPLNMVAARRLQRHPLGA